MIQYKRKKQKGGHVGNNINCQMEENEFEEIIDEKALIKPELENRQEERLENTLRPQRLEEYIGQTKVKENMKIYIEAAKKEMNHQTIAYFMDLQDQEKQQQRI